MSKRLIVAVGGSGQTVVSHYLRYATMAGVPGEELPNIFILDADLKQAVHGDEAKPSLFGQIEKLHGRLVAGLSPANKPTLHLLYPYNADTSLAAKQTFAEFLIGNRAGSDAGERQKVLDGLFGRQEQEITIAEGFFARPNVGATAIFEKMLMGGDDPSLNLLRHAVTSPDGPRVAVIGSTFGGTGSGGAPVIAQELRKWAGNRNRIKIGVFLTLPWFSPGDLGKSYADSTDTLGKWDTQWKNTAAGLRFYGTSKVFLNDLDVFIADFNGEKHPRWDDSNTGQPEYPHCFNLLLAAQVQNYLTRTVSPEEEPAQYSFYFVAQKSNWRNMQLDGHDSPLLRFNAPSGNQEDYLRQDLADWALQTQTLRLALREIAYYMRNDFKPADRDKRERPEKFTHLSMALAKSCQPHMPDAIVDAGKWPFRRQEPSPRIYSELASDLVRRAEELGAVIDWLRDAWRQSGDKPRLSEPCTTPDPAGMWNGFPALIGEPNAEVGAIKLFEDAFKHAGNVVGEFNSKIDTSREGGQQDPFHAAAAIIEKLLREAIVAKGGANLKGGKDEDAPALGHDETVAPLIPVQVSTTGLCSRYALAVELPKVLDHGRDRDGRAIDIFNESHPATLTGVTHYNVPSPWAAAHLNKWVQSAGRDHENIHPLWVKAKENLEATLWGVFTGQMEIRTMPYKELSRLGKILSGALASELYGYTQTGLCERVVYASLNGKTIALNHPACGWFIAPAVEQEEGMPWWQAEGITLPSQLTVPGADSLEAGQLQAFRDFLKNLLDSSHREDTGEPAGWYRVVGALSDELGKRIPANAKPAATVPVGAPFYLLDEQSQSLFSVPLMALSHPKEKLVDEYCVEEVALVDLDGDKRPADSPLKSKYLGQPGYSAQYLGTSQDAEGKTLLRYRLNLDGHGMFEIERPARQVDFRTHTEIWPNFKMPGWNIYFIASQSADDSLAKNFAFSLFDAQNSRIGPAKRSFSHNHEIQGAPEYLVMELVGENREAGIFSIALQNIEESGNLFFNLAVDLGTSHSCLCATTTGGQPARIPLDLSEPAQRFGQAIFNYPKGREEFVARNNTFLPFYTSPKLNADISVLPTELRQLGRPKPADLSNGVKSFVILPMVFTPHIAGTLEHNIRTTQTLGGFKWLDAIHGNEFQQQERSLKAEYLRQYLCMSAALLRVSGYRRLQMLRATYPEAFSYPERWQYAEVLVETMQMVLAATGVDYIGGELTPEKMLDIAYSQTSDQQFPDLQKNTSGLVSESVAALLSATSDDYNFFAEPGICLVLDMGGGTTDVAAYISKGTGKTNAQQTIDSVTDSIRYAGHDLLRLLAVKKIVDDILPNWDASAVGATTTEEDRCLDALKILVRDPKLFDKLLHNFNSPNYQREIKERMLLFFKGLYEYTRLLILAYQKQRNPDGRKWVLNIALFGNAWKLAELVYPSRHRKYDGFNKSFQDYLAAALGADQEIHIHYQDLPRVSIKEATALGALKLNAMDNQVATPKEHASLAGLDVVCHQQDGTDNEVPADGFLDGFDREIFDKFQPLTVKSLASLRKQPFLDLLKQRYSGKDNDFITTQVSAALNQAIHEQWIVCSDPAPMKFSPMRLFLEHVWKETLSTAPLEPQAKSK